MDKWIKANIPELSGINIIITGANSGLGFETSKALAFNRANVIMTGRNQQKLEAAKQEIISQDSNAKIETKLLDLADLESIKKFTDDIRLHYNRINILINNAGVMAPPRAETKNGFELQFGTNHLGHFALTAKILPLMKKTEGSRVVTVSSLAAQKGEIHFDDIMSENKYSRFNAYRQSKLANLMFAIELDDRLKKSSFKTESIAAHPGVSDTELFNNMNPNFFIKILGKLLMPVITQSGSKGALPQLYAATSENVSGGDYYGPDGRNEHKGYPDPAFIPEAAKDKDQRNKLWELSEKLTGIKFEIK